MYDTREGPNLFREEAVQARTGNMDYNAVLGTR